MRACALPLPRNELNKKRALHVSQSQNQKHTFLKMTGPTTMDVDAGGAGGGPATTAAAAAAGPKDGYELPWVSLHEGGGTERKKGDGRAPLFFWAPARGRGGATPQFGRVRAAVGSSSIGTLLRGLRTQ